VAGLAATEDVRPVVPPEGPTSNGTGTATLFAVSASAFVRHRGNLIEECFGPTALIVEYGSVDELVTALDAVPASLTTTLHADAAAEPELVAKLLDRAAAGAGRVIFGGWPTGVAVTAAQHHGGPWPATTSVLHTSVGTAAIRRFLRPVAYQGVPDALLPAALQDGNPLSLPRRVNGVR
jgi:NADP-dependent aldehyde dehydrogenase